MTRKHLSWDDSLCTGVRECALDSMESEGRIPVDGGNYVNEVNLTSQFRLQVQCSSFSFTISLLSWLHCILLSLVYIFDSYSSSLCSAPLSPAATLCFSLLLLYLLLFLLLPFLQRSFLSFSCFTSFGLIQNICAPPAGHQGPLLVILVHKVTWCTEIRPAN